MSSKDQGPISYSYRDTAAYAESQPAPALEAGPPQEERPLFQLPSERFAADAPPKEGMAVDGAGPQRPSAADSQLLIPVEMTFDDAAGYLAYRNVTYGVGEGPAYPVSVKMRERDLHLFRQFQSGVPILELMPPAVEKKEQRKRHLRAYFAIFIVAFLGFSLAVSQDLDNIGLLAVAAAIFTVIMVLTGRKLELL